jgi:hypothetical protein
VGYIMFVFLQGRPIIEVRDNGIYQDLRMSNIRGSWGFKYLTGFADLVSVRAQTAPDGQRVVLGGLATLPSKLPQTSGPARGVQLIYKDGRKAWIYSRRAEELVEVIWDRATTPRA